MAYGKDIDKWPKPGRFVEEEEDEIEEIEPDRFDECKLFLL